MKLPAIPDLSQLMHQISTAPQWAASAAVVAVTLVLLILYTLAQRRGRSQAPRLLSASSEPGKAVRATVAAAGPLAVLGACGMLVSLYGLFGFATHTMQLPVPFAVPFMAIWDLAEVVCFVSLYRSALVEDAWTRPMRRTRRTAWGLVSASAAMNAAHAPGNWVAMIFFALVPAVSAKLIEHELDRLLSANADEEDEDTTPGLVRLIQLGYVHVWAEIFARLGLDATSRGGVIHQDARIRRAARKIRALGIAMDAEDAVAKTPPGETRRTRKDREKKVKKATSTVEALQGKAELAIDVAGIAGDTPAQLLLARHLTARGRVKDLARMDTSDPMGMVALLEDLSIVPSVEAIQEGARAAQARTERLEAEDARDKALNALKEAQEEAEETRRQAAADLDEAKATLDAAHKAATGKQQAAEQAEEAKQQAEEATQRAKEERDKLTADIEHLRTRSAQLKTQVDTGESQERQMDEQLTALQEKADALRKQVSQYEETASKARDEARQALDVKRAAAGDVERAQEAVNRLAKTYEEIERATKELTGHRDEVAAEIERLTTQRQEAETRAGTARDEVARVRDEARDAERKRNAVMLALQTAREEVLEALTAPEATTGPRWTSPAKRRGWDLYLHTVHTEGREPTDQELAGADRDSSTARKWLPEFRAELARITAAELPAQKTAHDRTPDRAPSLV